MFNGFFYIPEPKNEPVLSYAPGSPERAELKAVLADMLANPVEIAHVQHHIPGRFDQRSVRSREQYLSSLDQVDGDVMGENAVVDQ